MKTLFYKLMVFAASISIVCTAVQAQNNSSQNYPLANTQTQNTIIQNSRDIEINKRAQQWDLQPEEWLHYQEIMDGPVGIYSPNLDPLTALGISASNDAERKHYAELQVIAESRRVERELLYQRAYDEAFKRLYPDLLLVSFASDPQPLMSAVSFNHSRLAVFVSDNCADCDSAVQQLQRSDAAFDIYMVDSDDNDVIIRRWATRAGILPQNVFSHNITLNHDAGRFQSLNIGSDLPAIVKEVDGKWQRQ